ncbi:MULTISPECIES: hypothetical protein [unclassified Sphingomonas]|jgi:hypothetical protein|uniref:hypothetical protein n=1 Tax=unclassified Sphingomonas TaxID=196159 RepID=UPI0025D601DB|nr:MULTISPECIES: hypothetical protein [unclassified Sphingomonas]
MTVLQGFALAALVSQQAVPPVPSQPSSAVAHQQRLAQAAKIGGLLYLYDRAAWVSSDALAAKVTKDQLTGIGGYVVEPIDGQGLRVTYFRGKGVDARAFFHADVRDGKVVDSDLTVTPTPLTPAQSLLARARENAAAAAVRLGYKPCTAAPFNTVVLPSPNGGPSIVYLLSAQLDLRSYPIGGNYRVIVGADGAIVANRPYSVACLNVEIPSLPPKAKPVGVIVNHLLDPVPTEIHVFASYNLRMPVFVGTPDRQIWKVAGQTITPADVKR